MVKALTQIRSRGGLKKLVHEVEIYFQILNMNVMCDFILGSREGR